MKKLLSVFICLFVITGVISAFSCEIFAGNTTYKDSDIKVGDILHMGNFINISGNTTVRYYYSVQEKKPFRTIVYKAGDEPSVKTIGDIFDVVVLYNEFDGEMRNIELYPLVNGGVGGVDVSGLSTDETVVGGSWMDFNGCRGKTRTIRYFKDGETEPFYTDASGYRYMRIPKRADTESFGELDYSVSYWHVKNVDAGSGTVDLVAGRDIGFADMIKANEMYRTQIVPAGTLIDYSAARYVSFHFYSSEYMYDKGKEFYCFDYDDRKEGEERFHIAGLGYSYPAYEVMSANTSHVHLVAIDGCYKTPDESVVYVRDLIAGDVVYNGSVLTFGSNNSCTINFYSKDGTFVSSSNVSKSEGITITNPDGIDAGSWVVSATDLYSIDLIALNFIAEGLLIPSNDNQNKDYYSGACVNLDGRNYYYYDRLSAAIVDAKVNTSLLLKDIIGDNNVLKNDLDCDKVLLVRNIDKIDAKIGAFTGVKKGIMIDFNGHSASGVCVGPISRTETLVFTNSREKKSYITGADAFTDNNTNKERTGTVVFNNLNIASKIYPAKHTIYLLNGEYILNSATVMDNESDNVIINDTEKCPLYKFYADYPYWVCSITPSDPSLDYPNGKKVESNGNTYYFYSDADKAKGDAKGDDVISDGIAVLSVKPQLGGTVLDPVAPTADHGNDTSLTRNIIIIAVIAVIAVGIVTAGILLAKKKKKK